MTPFEKLDTEFAEFVNIAQKMPRDLGQTFDAPDDDWMPVMFLRKRKEDDSTELIVAAFDPAFVSNATSKDDMARAMGMLVQQARADACAILLSAWMVQIDKEEADENGIPRPSEHPERVESLILQVIDAGHYEAYNATILRDGEQPPALTDWERLDDGTGKNMSGRFVDTLQKVFGHGH